MDKWLLKSGGALLINSGALSQVLFDFAMCLCIWMSWVAFVYLKKLSSTNINIKHALPDYYLTSTLLTIMLLL